MAFEIHINANAGNAKSEIAGVERALSDADKAAGRFIDKLGRMHEASGRFVGSAKAAGNAAAEAGDRAAAGADKARKGHEGAKAAADGHGSALERLIALAGTYVAVHQLESIVDGYIEIRNKTNSVATSAENLNALMDEQFRIAQETRSSWEDLAGTYQRISNAGRGLGLSQREILNLTEELSMGMRLSGSSSREASMTMMELTHAFTVGTLTGREFRVMMKDAPALMHELQVVSGKTGAEFAEMGKKGKFTAQTLVEWFDKAKDTIAEKFGQTIPTIGEGFTLIRNAAQKFFGEAGLGSGVVQKLGAAMKFVADNMEPIAKSVLAVGEALLALFVIEKIVTMVKALTLALAANPLTALLVGLTVAISLLRQFGDQIDTGLKAYVSNGKDVVAVSITVGDQLGAIWEIVKKLGAEIGSFLSDVWSTFGDKLGEGVTTDGLQSSLSRALRLVAGFVGGVRGLFHEMVDDSDKLWSLLAYTIVDVMTKAFNALMKAFGEMFSSLRHVMFDVLNETEVKRSKARTEAEADFGRYQSKSAIVVDDNGAREVTNSQRMVQIAASNIGYGAAGSPVTKADLTAEVQRLANMQREAGLAEAYAKQGLDAKGNDPRETRTTIGHIDNPLDYFDTDLAKKAHGAIDNIKDYAKSAMADFDKTARDIAVQRAATAGGKGAVGTDKGKADAALHDEKAEAAEKKYLNQLRAIEEQTNPMVAAQEKLKHAQEFLNDAVAHHHLPAEQAARDIENMKRKYADQLAPLEAWIRAQNEASEVLRSTTEETERAARMQAFMNKMKQDGRVVTDDEVEGARKLIATTQHHAEVMKAEQAAMADAHGGARLYDIQLEAINRLEKDGGLDAAEHATQLSKLKIAYFGTGEAAKTAAAGVERAQLKLKESSQDLGSIAEKLVTEANGPAVTYKATVEALSSAQVKAALSAKQMAIATDANRAAFLAADAQGRTFFGGMEQVWLKLKQDADSFGQTVGNTLVGGLDKLNDALVTAANGGQVAWGKMADAIIQDLEKILLKQAEVAAIGWIGNGVNAAAGAAGSSGAGDVIAPVADVYRTAGPYPYQGSGAGPAGGAAPQQSPVVVEVHNHYDESVTHAAMSSPKGRQIFVNTMRATGYTPGRSKS